MSLVRALRHRLAREDGYSLVELLTVLVILGTVLGALTGLFVSASRAELDMNERFQAQQNARLALTKMRRDVHCASAATTTPAAPALAPAATLTLPSVPVGACGTAQVSWCTVPLGTGRFGLYRKQGAACNATGVKVADHLTAANVFSYTAQTSCSLATLAVDLPVDRDPKDARAAYRLRDTLAVRRSGRLAAGQPC